MILFKVKDKDTESKMTLTDWQSSNVSDQNIHAKNAVIFGKYIDFKF